MKSLDFSGVVKAVVAAVRPAPPKPAGPRSFFVNGVRVTEADAIENLQRRAEIDAEGDAIRAERAAALSMLLDDRPSWVMPRPNWVRRPGTKPERWPRRGW